MSNLRSRMNQLVAAGGSMADAYETAHNIRSAGCEGTTEEILYFVIEEELDALERIKEEGWMEVERMRVA